MNEILCDILPVELVCIFEATCFSVVFKYVKEGLNDPGHFDDVHLRNGSKLILPLFVLLKGCSHLP